MTEEVHRQRINRPDAEPAVALAKVARYLETQREFGNAWIVTGPGVNALRLGGRVVEKDLSIIGAGTAMVHATADLANVGADPEDQVLAAALTARVEHGFPMDATWVADRILLDRPKAARAYRVAIGRSTPVELDILGEADHSPLRIRVARPIDAYFVELARYHEAPRGSAARAHHDEQAHKLYDYLGAASIDSEIRDLRAIGFGPRGERAALGVRRSDADVFEQWHCAILRDRGTSAKPGFFDGARSSFRKVMDWSAGRDLPQAGGPSISR